MSKSSDYSPLSAEEQAIFKQQVAGVQETVPDVLNVTDGYDSTPRPFELTDIGRGSGLPVGHIAFLGDFDAPKNS